MNTDEYWMRSLSVCICVNPRPAKSFLTLGYCINHALVIFHDGRPSRRCPHKNAVEHTVVYE